MSSGVPRWARVTNRVSRWAKSSSATQVCRASISTTTAGASSWRVNRAASCSVRSSWSTSLRDRTSKARLILDSPGARLAAKNANRPTPRAGIRWCGHIKRRGISVATMGTRPDTGNPVPSAVSGSVSYPHVRASMNASAVFRGVVFSASSSGSNPSATRSDRMASSARSRSTGRRRESTDPGYEVISFTSSNQRLKTPSVKRAPKLTLPASVPRFSASRRGPRRSNDLDPSCHEL